MTKMLLFPAALEAAGVNVRVLDTWDLVDPAGYEYRESDGNPAGHMHHHTATASYVPNTVKANGYAGMSKHGSARLYQEDYGDSIPVYTIANAYPAPVSSGYGDYGVLVKVRQGAYVAGRQGPDNPPKWAGNTHYWNTEWILDGVGAHIEDAVWEMMLTVCRVQNDLMGWTPNMHIAHGHHTRRKIDLFGGQYLDFNDTIIDLREQMGDDMKWSDIVADATWAKAYEDGFIQGNPSLMPDYYFEGGPATEDEKKNAYNVIMQNQMEATK